MQSQPVSKSKKTEYDIFFQIVKEQENKLPLRRVKHKTAHRTTQPANLVFHTSSTLNQIPGKPPLATSTLNKHSQQALSTSTCTRRNRQSIA
jgi:hypothetical protein